MHDFAEYKVLQEHIYRPNGNSKKTNHCGSWKMMEGVTVIEPDSEVDGRLRPS